MSWFNREKEKVTTTTKEKKEVPDGLWQQCPKCKKTMTADELKTNLYVCPDDNFHLRIDSKEYFSIIFDNGNYKELFANLSPIDHLKFKDLKEYSKRIVESQNKTGLKDAMRVGAGNVNKLPLVVACMDFSFIGGSMGSIVGEKISRAIDYCIKHKTALMIISKSGGARMMESAFSLMQMAKTSAKLTLLADKQIPYISLMTDPTTGGVTASYSMLGDLNIAEPGALIGFAGPRVIKETIKRDLPEGFQSSEFLLEKGFLDFIVHRHNLKQKLAEVLELFRN